MDIWQGRDDSYKPNNFKESLAQYDNYQIHDLYCVDIVYSSIQTGSGLIVPPPPQNKFRSFLGVERVSPFGVINCNFEAIAIAYP